MGYYSKVAIECSESVYKQFQQLFKDLSNAGTPFSPDKVDSYEKGSYEMLWYNIKWYEEFPEVQAIEHLMNELDQLDSKESEENWYSFHRCGEDIDDISERNNSGYEGSLYVDTCFATFRNGKQEVIAL